MYVDAYYDKNTNLVKVVERAKNGDRVFKQFPANYTLYYDDEDGSHFSIFRNRVKKFTTNNLTTFNRQKKKLVRENINFYEDDINPVFRILEENYRNCELPDLRISFFDIEAGFDNVRGYAPVDDPFNPITAISVHEEWTGVTYTYVLKPSTVSGDEATTICNEFDNTFLYDDEEQMLLDAFKRIRNADVISGWNSTGYDIPYMVNRAKTVMGRQDAARLLCLFDTIPKKREYVKFKKKSITYDTIGIVHLDYLELYQKHNQQQLHSYTLDFVGQHEVKERKTEYNGTLQYLYEYDFKTFITYNRQDVKLLCKIDAAKRFIHLASQVAHSNSVVLRTTMGSVALITQAIALFAHEKFNVVIPGSAKKEDETFDDIEEEEKDPAIGAFVSDPKVGVHKKIGAIDLNSLYPSVLRSLNMSPETLFGQIRQTYTEAWIENKRKSGIKDSDIWHGEFSCQEYQLVMKKTNDVLILDFDDDTYSEITAADLYDIIFAEDSFLIISANGTLFRKDVEGIIPAVLAEWYADRKAKQKREKMFDMFCKDGMEIPQDILELI